ncbi:MAG: hypothetical protein J6Z23_07560 [Lachnospiraceae bacterium]|nr:hypothetical protein [Lachnospiraceae bacterium]
MNVLNAPLRRIAAFQETDRMLRDGRGPVQLAGCVESQKVQVMHEAGGGAARLVVTSDEKGARTLYEDWKFFSPDVYLFPEKDLLFYQADVRSDHLTKDRIRTIRALTEALERGTDIAVITTMYGAMNILPDPETFRKARIPLSEGDTVEPEALVRLLVSAGYTRTARVENPGEFAFHGSILDLFDLTEDLPVRIEFWDDEIDTIRTFSPESQITIERKTETVIYPASELFPDTSSFREARQAILEEGKKALEAFKARQQWDEGASMQQLLRRAEDALDARDLSALESYLPYFYRRQATILDYFPENAVRVLEEPSRLEESGQFAETEYTQSFGMRLLKGLALPGRPGC